MVIGEIGLHESAMCSEKIGINCSCFSVEAPRKRIDERRPRNAHYHRYPCIIK